MNRNLSNVLRIWISLFTGWGLNYLYQYLMIQKLNIVQYADLSSLLSLINIVWTITLGLTLYVVKEFSKDSINLTSKVIVYKNLFIKIGSFLFFFLLLFSPLISLYLNIQIYLLIISLFSIFLFSISIYQWAFFQSTGRFIYTSLWQILNPLIRIIAAIALISIWTGVYWAIWGFIVSQIGLFTLWYYLVKKHSHDYNIKGKESQKQILSSFLSQKKQILQYLFTSVLIALLMNIDILIVKNMFDAETAGYYAAVSVLAKFLVFLWLSIETVYYPQLVKETVFPKLQILKISSYYILLTLWSLVFFWLFGEIVLRLFKDGLEQYLSLIYPLLIYCGLLAYLSIIVKTLIAFEHYMINYLLGVLIVLLIIALYSFQNSPLLVTQIFALFGGGGLLLGMSQVVRR